MLTRQPTVELLVHELGHALGLGHAQSSDCRGVSPAQCGFDETGDPFSPMGHGMLDFSAYEKVVLGWLPAPPHATAAKRYVLAPPTFRSKLAQGLVIEAADGSGSWWIEYRAKPFRGLLVRFVENRDLPPFARSAALMTRTVKPGRPWIARGESYRIPGSFRVTLLKAAPLRAELRLRYSPEAHRYDELVAVTAQTKLNAEKLRADFPIFEQQVRGKPLAYLDSAVSAHKPRRVLDKLRNFYETSYANVHRGVYTLSEIATAEYEGARDKVARFINAPASR